ncbi:MAG: RNA-binding protein [Pseudoalteromonas sp.]|uniref:RNA-binding protein n=1 Tax=unclassified Pseudoalteromonas TaxID=194690 RepID=UPI003F9D4F93
MYKLFVLLLTVFYSHIAAAKTNVYHCTIEGTATFSQFPCGKDAKKVNIAVTNIAKSAVNNDDQGVSAEIGNYLTGQQIDRQIKKSKNNIKKLQEQLNSRKIQIDYMTQDSANRLGASSISDAITQQRNKVDQLYKPKIEQQQKQIDQLTALKSKIDQGS